MEQINLISEGAGIKTWLREKLTPRAWIRMFAEGLIPDYASKMEALREIDDQIFGELKSSRELVNAMRDSLKSARYIDVAFALEEFHKTLKNVFVLGGQIKQVQEEAMKEFDREHVSTNSSNELVKEAGWWTDLTRGWVAAKFEDSFRKERRLALDKLVREAENFQNRLDMYQSTFGKLRASGEIGQYLDKLSKLDADYNKFKSVSEPIYNNYLKPLVDQIHTEINKNQEAQNLPHVDELTKQPEKTNSGEETKLDQDEKARELDEVARETFEKARQSLEDEATEPEVTTEELIVEEPAKRKRKPRVKKELPVPVIEPRAESFVTEKVPVTDPELPPAPEKLTHDLFLAQLKKVAELHDPYLLANMILDYSELMEDQDLNTSLGLISIAEEIID